ncbi:MAG: hypothetical protein AMR96_00180 [Candidatus Adiutrix intracellularis]|nr:MAG: hypothetical protein AMR96_00180 [Candidatus Adiutrix intracellularis]
MSDLSQLEETLKKAAANPEARPAFYETLMNSTVHVVGTQDEEILDEAPYIHLKQWLQPDGSMAIPFFPTLAILQKVLKDEQNYLELPVPDLFRLTRGVTLVLTTAGNLAKAFQPAEVETLLASRMTLDPLAKALAKAARDSTEESRRNFYNVLINSRLFVFGEPKDQRDGQPPTPGNKIMAPDDQFLITSISHPFHKEERVLPFFSSEELLTLAAGRFKVKGGFLVFQALPFFNMIKSMDQTLMLNPGFAGYKLFTQDEIDFLLQAATQEPFEQRTYKPGGKIFLGPPEPYPQELVSAFLDFFPGYPEVLVAYLTTLREDTEDAPPTLVIGLETEGDLTAIIRAAGPLVVSHSRSNWSNIDFAKVTFGEKGLSQYFLDQVSPFYRRTFNQDQAVVRSNQPPKETVVSEQKNFEGQGFISRLKRVFSGSN